MTAHKEYMPLALYSCAQAAITLIAIKSGVSDGTTRAAARADVPAFAVEQRFPDNDPMSPATPLRTLLPSRLLYAAKKQHTA